MSLPTSLSPQDPCGEEVEIERAGHEEARGHRPGSEGVTVGHNRESVSCLGAVS